MGATERISITVINNVRLRSRKEYAESFVHIRVCEKLARRFMNIKKKTSRVLVTIFIVLRFSKRGKKFKKIPNL